MIKNHLLSTIRMLRKHRGFSFIHISGLSLGIASAMAIFVFVKHELSYDRHQDHERVYRLIYDETQRRPEDGRLLATTSPPMGPTLKQTFPQIEHAVRLRMSERDLIAAGDRRFYEDQLVYADADFFHVFHFPLVAGDPSTALSEPNSVVISGTLASKYFGTQDPMGQAIELNDEIPLKVTGVLADRAGPSHLRFDFLVSFSTFKVPTGYPVTMDSWGWTSFHTYFKLADGARADDLEKQFTDFVQSKYMTSRAGRFDLRLQPVADIYLGSVRHADIAAGNRTLIYGLALVGILVIVVAALNYVNLATTRSLNRAREVGIRKVVGAGQGDVMRQFLSESVLITSAGAVVSLFIFNLFLEWLMPSVGFSVSMSGSDIAIIITASLALGLVIGVVAGGYPAFVASQFEALKVMKGWLRVGPSGVWIRRTLLTGQFVVTIGLIAATFIINDQMNFIRGRDLGYNRDAVLVLQMTREGSDVVYPRVRDRLMRNPNVAAVTGCSSLLDGDNGNVPIFYEGNPDGSQMDILGVQYGFLKTMHIDRISGREFDVTHPMDRDHAVVVNRSAATMMGWKDPVGKKIRVGDIITDGKVIGLIEDFHHASLYETLTPLVLFISDLIENIYVRVHAGNMTETLASIEADWKLAAPNLPFQFTFLDDHLASMYRSDERFAALLSFFSILEIIVAGLGLYGLISFITIQRTREIGIRKVLGASIGQVVLLLSRQFIAIVTVALLIAAPVTFQFMQVWLNSFAYRIDLGWHYFAFAGVSGLFLAGLAMGYECIRAARANPIQSLKSE